MTRASDLAKTAEVLDNSSFMFRNRIINGSMDVWQRGTSATGATYLAADRWASDQANTTHTRSTSVPSGFLYSLQVSASSGTSVAFQKIESINCLDLAGQTVTISFWAKSASGTPSLNTDLRHATAGVDNYSSFGFSGSTSVTLSTTWTRYSYNVNVNATYGANGLALFFYNISTATFFIAGVQVELGSYATPFERRMFDVEYNMCRRYFEKSYNLSMVPGTADMSHLFTTSPDGYSLQPGVVFAVEKRVAPTITLYSTNGASGNIRRWDASNQVASGGHAHTNGFLPQGSGITANVFYAFHWTASAEI